MVIVRARVTCDHCKKFVDRSETRYLFLHTGEKIYECFHCYKRNPTGNWSSEELNVVKRELYCERCKYRFKAKVAICPYCSKGDKIESGNISVKDLVGDVIA